MRGEINQVKVVFGVLTSYSVVCSTGLEKRTASICEIAAMEQVDAEQVGGRTLSLLNGNILTISWKPRQQLFPAKGLFWTMKNQKNVCTQLNWRGMCHHRMRLRTAYLPDDPTNQPTPWSNILLEKLTVTQPVRRLLPCYGTRSLNTVCTTTCPSLSLSWARRIQSTSSQPVYVRSILTSSAHLCQSSQRYHSFRFPHQNPVHNFIFQHDCHMPCLHLHPHSDHPNNIWQWVQIVILFIM